MRIVVAFLFAWLSASACPAVAGDALITPYPEAPHVAIYPNTFGGYLAERTAYWIDDENLLYRTFDKDAASFHLVKFNIATGQTEKVYDVGGGRYCYDPLSRRLLIQVENKGLKSQPPIWDMRYFSGYLGEPLEKLEVHNPQFAKFFENKFDCTIMERDRFSPAANPPVVMALRTGDGALRVQKEDFKHFYLLTTDDGAEYDIPVNARWAGYVIISYNRNADWYWIVTNHPNSSALYFVRFKVDGNDVAVEQGDLPPLPERRENMDIFALPVRNGWAVMEMGAMTSNAQDRKAHHFYIVDDGGAARLVAKRDDHRRDLLDVSPDGCKVAMKAYLSQPKKSGLRGNLEIWNVCG